MTPKVTINVVIVFIILTGCARPAESIDDLQFQQQLDSMASASIDSAYQRVQDECDEKMKSRLPVLIDSLINIDSLKK